METSSKDGRNILDSLVMLAREMCASEDVEVTTFCVFCLLFLCLFVCLLRSQQFSDLFSVVSRHFTAVWWFEQFVWKEMSNESQDKVEFVQVQTSALKIRDDSAKKNCCSSSSRRSSIRWQNPSKPLYKWQQKIPLFVSRNSSYFVHKIIFNLFQDDKRYKKWPIDAIDQKHLISWN